MPPLEAPAWNLSPKKHQAGCGDLHEVHASRRLGVGPGPLTTRIPRIDWNDEPCCTARFAQHTGRGSDDRARPRVWLDRKRGIYGYESRSKTEGRRANTPIA